MTTQFIKHAFKKANSFEKSGLITHAIGVYENIIKEDNTSFDAYYLLGLCYYRLKDFKNSVKSIKKAIDLYPNHAESYFKLALCYKKSRDFQNALLYLKKLLK